MKKYLLILFLSVSAFACDDKANTEEKPEITSVSFSKATTGSISRVRVNLSLQVPALFNVKRVDMMRGTTRLGSVLSTPTTGDYVVYDNSAEWDTHYNVSYYTFIFVMDDDTEIRSSSYLLK